MSPTSDPIVIGSYAAALHGILPDWRGGHVGDIDLLCSRGRARALAAMHSAPFREHVAERCMIQAEPLRFDIGMSAALYDRAIGFVVGRADILGIGTCLLASAAFVAALRIVSVDVVARFSAKARQDAAFYLARIDIPVDLLVAARAFLPPDFTKGE